MTGGTARPADLPVGESADPRPDTVPAPPINVLFVEASSGGVLGGSLTGLYHLMRGMDRDRFRLGMVLYETKPIEADLARLDVAVHHVSRRRLPKQHGLLGEHPELHCVVAGGVHRAGEGYAAALRARIAELGLGARVHLIGFRADIPDVMNAWDIVIHASVRPEPFGRVILEGMLLGKPVVATDAGGVPELITHEQTGFLVPPGDAAALAAQLRQLLAAPDRARAIGARSREWARERFALGRHVAEMSQIYTDAARIRHT